MLVIVIVACDNIEIAAEVEFVCTLFWICGTLSIQQRTDKRARVAITNAVHFALQATKP